MRAAGNVDAAVAALQSLTSNPQATLRARVQRGMDLRARREAAADAEFHAAAQAVSGMSPAAGPVMMSEQKYSVGNGRNSPLNARFDTALTTDDNSRHWSMADGLAIDAAANPNIRYVLRNRSRYEVFNNSYAKGMVETLANDVIGTGPRLQMNTGDELLNAAIETAFADWQKATSMADKLRQLKKAKTQDGEAFCKLVTNTGLDSPVKLDVKPIEADHVRFVDLNLFLVPSVDGIRYDEFDNPETYHVLRVHPGFWSYATGYVGMPWEYDQVPARSMIHWYRVDRPGQHRGLPEILAALPLYAQLRRFVAATLDAAETAADMAMTMETGASANVEPVACVPGDVFELQRRMMTQLPAGWKLGQTRPEQPATTMDMFVRLIIQEIARCLNMPFNVACGNSSGYNYASGRLDHQVYFKSIGVERGHCELAVVDRVFHAWFAEAILVSNLLPLKARTLGRHPNHSWHWDGHEHVDPAKEASADETRLRSGTTTYHDIFARAGKDATKAMAAQAAALGLTIEEYREKLVDKLFAVPGGGADPAADQAAALLEQQDREEAGQELQPAGAVVDDRVESPDQTEDL